ncbi:hypothetical protein BUALT_Bualt02G0231200 [Buddleja alternifolia]|uniref:Transcription factor CBF/NF-Y/archaeal histone domain-containing protein n=1 Tax=Buddleja alternifolia TaxID=168488 RepID=A0AAV6YDD3_9LAMI|nr:hypothetical protein BUALT_Bualt02G0231200 [Buddleja alternifolia]
MVDNIGPKYSNTARGLKYTYNAPIITNYTSGGGGGGDEEEYDQGLIKEQDRLLPIANVGRIMKQILPPNAKISKEAKETMQECVSEFISFVTGEASDKCHKEKRKTVNGDDICWALGSLGFDDYSEPLKRYLSKYREAEGERVNQNKAAAAAAAGIDDQVERDESSNGRDETRRAGPSHPAPFSFNLMEKRRY